jgi:hypothetical protein
MAQERFGGWTAGYEDGARDRRLGRPHAGGSLYEARRRE